MAPGKVLLVDDRLLLSILIDDRSAELKAVMKRRPVYTTGHWYYRLCHAIRSTEITGALSGALQRAPLDIQQRVTQSLIRLPEDVGLVSFRDLAPTMASLSLIHRLNVLSLEALAAAIQLPAEVLISSTGVNPTLMTALELERVRFRLVTP
jgi:hypothetical protein